MSWPISPRVDLHNHRISAEDADRQMRTATEILRRLERQPGVVLADEVGMGKTFVALAVAVSVAEATGGAHPVVVMVPPGVQDKWPREWDVFRQECLRPGGRDVRASVASVRRGSDFLKLLDDPAARRRHIVFLTHGALTSSLADPLVRLAIVRRAMHHRPTLARQRQALARWAGQLFAYRPFRDQHLVADLLETHPRRWARVWTRHNLQPLDDDPVPETLLAALGKIDLAPMVDALTELPLYHSAHIEARLRRVRATLTQELDGLWRGCLGALDVRLPLLILDEAHHLKTRGPNWPACSPTPKPNRTPTRCEAPSVGSSSACCFSPRPRSSSATASCYRCSAASTAPAGTTGPRVPTTRSGLRSSPGLWTPPRRRRCGWTGCGASSHPTTWPASTRQRGRPRSIRPISRSRCGARW
jgi:hypothetical protein